jgi:peptide/nickel transport system permease protein
MPEEAKSFRADAIRRITGDKVAVGSAIYIACLILIATFAPLIAPYSYSFQSVSEAYNGPSYTHWFGTDQLGRDILSRVIWGARVSISVGLGVTAITATVGVVVGVLSGFFGGWVDTTIMRLTDMVFAFPGILFAILMMAILGPSILNVFVALSITHWAGIARIVRSNVLSVKESEFVEAARAMGARDKAIILRHVLPQIMSPVIVSSTMNAGTFILSEASLSFLGIGISPPFPSWGAMIAGATQNVLVYPYMIFFPSLGLAGLILAFNFLGDSLRDALDPRLKI